MSLTIKFAVIFLVVIGLYIVVLATADQTTIDTECFDERNNKIKELTCEESVYTNQLIENSEKWVALLMLFTVLGLIGVFFWEVTNYET